ncbi:MAG TPA: FGGY-family carbohydrate kinase [Balneolaceae bacterium]|nr:FGGY-family carbohydrate kinase [Balneolaceae bacterium]
MNDEFIIGCDVGTGSVRAGLFNKNGRMLAMATHDISVWRPQQDFVEQSSENIWNACCKCVKSIVKDAEINPQNIKGMGFDATCSLVVLDENDQSLSVSPTDRDERNIIVWMDHRAKNQAKQINKIDHEVLKYVGNRISPEMQIPKLLWLKKHRPDTWNKAGKFLDLADFMVLRATGKDIRSLCTTTCKWTYLGHGQSATKSDVDAWSDSFFVQVGLKDLVEEEYKRIGRNVQPVGEAVGEGLSPKAANELELIAGTPVSVGMIDAHAGGLGLLGMQLNEQPINFETRLALIGGTSSCHMVVSNQPRFIEGVWGPYYSAMIPGMWLNEGGQSATGALIDHIIFSSDHADKLREKADNKNTTVYQLLNKRVNQLTKQQNKAHPDFLTKDLHVLPYFHGNRSPRANPSLVGSICGLRLSSTLDDLAVLYLATIQAIAYGTRHIIEALDNHGYSIDTIIATGGGTKNNVFLKQHANICNCKLILPEEREAVLLGSAVLAAVASGVYPNILSAMKKMNHSGTIIEPKQGITSDYHHAKYRVFKKMYQDEISYSKQMNTFV